MKKELTELENVLTKLKLKASNLKNENKCLKNENKVCKNLVSAKQNKNLKFKVNWLLVLIGLGLITWLASDQQNQPDTNFANGVKNFTCWSDQ